MADFFASIESCSAQAESERTAVDRIDVDGVDLDADQSGRVDDHEVSPENDARQILRDTMLVRVIIDCRSASSCVGVDDLAERRQFGVGRAHVLNINRSKLRRPEGLRLPPSRQSLDYSVKGIAGPRSPMKLSNANRRT